MDGIYRQLEDRMLAVREWYCGMMKENESWNIEDFQVVVDKLEKLLYNSARAWGRELRRGWGEEGDNSPADPYLGDLSYQIARTAARAIAGEWMHKYRKYGITGRKNNGTSIS